MAEAAIIAAIITAAASAAESEKAQKAAESREKKTRRFLATNQTAPVPQPEEGMGGDLTQWLRRRRGRASTVLAGDLQPMDVGKRTLLG